LKQQNELLNSQSSSLGVDDYKTIELYNMNTLKPIKLNKKEEESLIRIDRAFVSNKGQFRSIGIYKNKITFETENDAFAIVYSLDGKKPTSLDIPNSQNYNFYVKELKPNWYQVTGTGK